MVTEDMLAAVFDALKGPKRVILLGDHRQLPPIGAGRPLVDLARELRPWDSDREPPFPRVGPGYTELTVHRRQTGKGNKGRDDLLFGFVVHRRSARSRSRRDLGSHGPRRDRRPCRSSLLADR